MTARPQHTPEPWQAEERMTRRERMERRAERRREWAEGRQSKAAACARVGDEHRDPQTGRMDWALVTQPGHIPERARINRAHERGHEHAKMADHHEAKAAGIEHQLATSIYSDDDDAAEALEAKAALIDAQADRAKALNAAFRKAPGTEKAEKLAALVRAGTMTQAEAVEAANLFGMCSWERQPFPAYHLTNLRANARRCRERIKDVCARTDRSAEAAAAPNGVKVDHATGCDWCRVTFAEKPAREILDALKAAGFRWTSGYWCGASSRLPQAVAELGAA
jgi:hypothetical protein